MGINIVIELSDKQMLGEKISRESFSHRRRSRKCVVMTLISSITKLTKEIGELFITLDAEKHETFVAAITSCH